VRILLASNYYPEHVGGIETIAASLAMGYRRRGHEVRWIAGDIGARPHVGHEDDLPIPVWNGIERAGFPYPLPHPRALSMIRRHVAWAQAVHLHDCLYALNVATFVAARRSPRPVLLTQHVAKVPYPNPLLRGLQSAAYASLGRAVVSRADQVVFVSDQVKRWFEARMRFRQAPLLIENGVDDSIFSPLPDAERQAARRDLGVDGAKPLLLFVGRFVEKKGVRLLRQLIEATPAWKWLLIGRSGEVDPASWRLPNLQVMSPLNATELRTCYAAADLLVLPSTGEGFPVVVQEAMACGTPALIAESTAAGLPAIRPVVFTANPGGDGLEAALRAAVDRVGAEPGLRLRVAACAVERWRSEVMVARYEQQLEALIT